MDEYPYEYYQGKEAFFDDKDLSDNPYPKSLLAEFCWWCAGYHDAENEYV